jgi:hypothetical protein
MKLLSPLPVKVILDGFLIFYEDTFMSDTLGALMISGGILLAVVVLITFVSIVTVKRGEASMHDESHGGRH